MGSGGGGVAFWAAAMQRDFCCEESDEEEVRESAGHRNFAGGGREVALEAAPIRLGSWHTGRRGGVGGWWSESCDEWGLYCEWESAKVQASLNGFASVT